MIDRRGPACALAAPDRITVVSGLPRAGTSLAMQLLAAAGLEIAADAQRPPDPGNPRGYFELSAVKAIRRDAGFLPACRGRVVKIVAPLILELPRSERYRVVFIEREIDEVLASQRALLARAGHPPPAAAEERALARTYHGVVARCRAWLSEASDTPAILLEHRSLIGNPQEAVGRLLTFLAETAGGPDRGQAEGAADVEALVRVVEPALYRSRAGS